MPSKAIILCCDDTKQQANLSVKLAQTYDKVLCCPLSKLDSMLAKHPSSTLVISWQQPCAELRIVIDEAERQERPLLVILNKLNAININSLPNSMGYALVPDHASFELQAWIKYAENARLQQVQMNKQLSSLTLQLAERKLVEKAKGLLMKMHNIDEDTAFKALRKSAMQNSISLSQVAKNLITTLEMVG